MVRQSAALKRMIREGRTVVAPGVFSPSVALLAEKTGFKAVYFSGAGFSNLQGLPDLGVTTLTEVATAVGEITSKVRVPVIVDVDTGFGEAVNASRSVGLLKSSGAAALQIEDQVLPKKCGHLEGKELVPVEEMVKKLAAVVETAAGDPLIIARTDARAVEGIDGAVARAREYARLGVDVIFPEALESRQEFQEFRAKVRVPLLANMTEFGKTPYLTVKDFEEIGYEIVIFPVTVFRAAMKAAASTLDELKKAGTQRDILKSLMSRKQVDELIGYDDYLRSDKKASRIGRPRSRVR